MDRLILQALPSLLFVAAIVIRPPMREPAASRDAVKPHRQARKGKPGSRPG
jgi:hypothetical protein